MRRFLIALLLALPAAAPLDSQPRRLEPIQVSGKKALIIANDRYRASPLQNPPRDARSMDGVLRELGFTVTTKFNLTQRAMEETIDTFATSVRPGELALVYYSGHGMQIEGENYLNPVDLEVRDETDAKYGSYSVSRLREKLERSGAKLRILILDACRDNPFRRGTRGGPVGLGGVQSAATGTFIAYATGDNSVADDNVAGVNGLFTGHLVSALREPGLTLDDVFQEVKEGVYVDSKQRQSPYTYSNVIGRFYFREAGEPGPHPAAAPGPKPALKPPTAALGGIDMTYFAGLHYGDDYHRAIALYGQPKRTRKAGNGKYVAIGFGQDANNTGVEIFYDKRTGKIAEVDVHAFELDLATRVAGSDPLLALIGKTGMAIETLIGAPQDKVTSGGIYILDLAGQGGRLLLWNDPVASINLAWVPTFINID